MGFLDSLQSSVNRGMAATGRATSTMKLKAQMSEALKRRQALAAQLGASLYDVTKDDANLRAGREALYDGIAACDAERAQCQVEIERLEAESAAATAANSYYVCPFCGSHVVTTDLFCSGCGKPMAEITAALSAQQQAPAAPVAPVSGAAACPQCGAPVNAGDVFCMSCGYNLA
ncbi:zinc-ribbon domain-containing protein, partial [Parolsenella catena]|uniref:zinc-ribbon domain-containing protein n=1 Tax=Parolsenella catena TaxID=2003188 RepID=UPI003AEFB401